ncbi:MAG TPA: hypothetical protein VMV59_12420 [Candidatus Dormibacteraeota bacterium]|nr:hypothetical protein [Candidatus Dormibacteraeota bacterium]
MTTLILQRSSSGISHRCDSTCHNATKTGCACICGGRYHGAGRCGDLRERVEKYGEEILESLGVAQADRKIALFVMKESGARFGVERVEVASDGRTEIKRNVWRARP